MHDIKRANRLCAHSAIRSGRVFCYFRQKARLDSLKA